MAELAGSSLAVEGASSAFPSIDAALGGPSGASAGADCKLCGAWCHETRFQERQWKRAVGGKPATCVGCQDAVALLKREAYAKEAAERSRTDGLAGGSLEVVSTASLRFWEAALEAVSSQVGAGQVGMLRRWLRDEMAWQAREPHHASARAHLLTMRSEQAPAWLEEARAERVVQYDLGEFPFPQLLCDLFESPDLAKLHEAEPPQRPPLCPTLLKAYHLAGVKRPRAWRQKERWRERHLQQFRASGPFCRFLEVYHRFVNVVVKAEVGTSEELLYQCPPTLRCQMPGVVPMGRPHRDSDFAAHHGAEINFWLPGTRVWGSNSLYAESSPGLEDFRPFELEPGQVLIFNGSRCLHYTKANSTDSTRVSFDFRVIPRSLAAGWRHAGGSAANELSLYEFASTV